MGLAILEEVGVLNLTRSPFTNVIGVLDHGVLPLALVLGVLNLGGLPLSAAMRSAVGVGDLRGFPVTILFIIPVIRLLRIGIVNHLGGIIKPVSRLCGIRVYNVLGSIFIPVFGLAGLGIGNVLVIYPVFGLEIFGIINHLGGVDSRVEVFEKAPCAHRLLIDKDLKAVVLTNDEGVEMTKLISLDLRGVGKVLLLYLAALGVGVAEDKVNLVGATTLVRAKHDSVRCFFGKLVAREALIE
mmetsp:Transcript_26562/g.68180  ORF Transcript_26562/g.68180 Transcript_26562/m.68180 type:complete len:241 (+) Transcript_26562:636-1358(+)